MLKPTIALSDSVGSGIIIDFPTGILVSNQTGGTACLQSSMEGIFVPIGNDMTTSNTLISPELELSKYFLSKYEKTGATDGIINADAVAIEMILAKYNLDNRIKVDISKLEKSHEAWIYVTINDVDLLKYFGSNLRGVLTWTNSD